MRNTDRRRSGGGQRLFTEAIPRQNRRSLCASQMRTRTYRAGDERRRFPSADTRAAAPRYRSPGRRGSQPHELGGADPEVVDLAVESQREPGVRVAHRLACGLRSMMARRRWPSETWWAERRTGSGSCRGRRGRDARWPAASTRAHPQSARARPPRPIPRSRTYPVDLLSARASQSTVPNTGCRNDRRAVDRIPCGDPLSARRAHAGEQLTVHELADRGGDRSGRGAEPAVRARRRPRRPDRPTRVATTGRPRPCSRGARTASPRCAREEEGVCAASNSSCPGRTPARRTTRRPPARACPRAS